MTESLTNGNSQPSPQDQLLTKLEQNPKDFPSWESLIALVEQTGKENPEQLKKAYESFLSHFPLLFGYWKKYADWIAALGENADEIYQRALKAVLSVDLWTQYCYFTMQTAPSDDKSRSVFEQAANAIGHDFHSHPFWDMYIQFEQDRRKPDNVFSILERIIRIPLANYVHYRISFASRPIIELAGSHQEEARLKAEVMNEHPNLTPQEVEVEMRLRIYNMKTEIYRQTQSDFIKRYTFETEIKRRWFHYLPLDDVELDNWRAYLDLEQMEGDHDSIALYEEFWIRYAKYFISKGEIDKAKAVYAKACETFIPLERPQIRLTYASFLEDCGDIDHARQVLSLVIEKQTSIHLAYFECRQGRPSDAIQLLQNTILSVEAPDSKAVIAAHVGKIMTNMLKSDSSDHFSSNQISKSSAKLQVSWEIVCESQISNTNKLDLGNLILSAMLERGYKWDVMKKLEKELDEIAKDCLVQTSNELKRQNNDVVEPPAKKLAKPAISSSFNFK